MSDYLNIKLPIPQAYTNCKSTYNPYIWLDNKDMCVKKHVLQQAIPIKWDTPQIKVHKWCKHCEHVSGSQLGWLQAVTAVNQEIAFSQYKSIRHLQC